MLAMIRVDDDTLSLHLEVAFSTAAPSVLDGLANPDRRQRQEAIGEIVRQLVERLRCFDIRTERDEICVPEQRLLFPADMSPLG